jgi:lipopolysaccharide export system protein LptA
MKKAFILCLTGFLSFYNYCVAQVASNADTVRVIEIMRGKSLREKSIDSVNKIETIAGNVLIRERLTKFSCDSAIINRKDNTIEAFGNVHINDADSLHTYSQYLKYYGNTRLAFLKREVKLNDTKGTLLTEDLDYDLAAGIGKFHNGGKVINGSSVLTSTDGIYYADTKDVYFKNNVDLTDPKYKIKADSLFYNTQTQIVTFTGPTYITSKEANIYTTQGTYDLKNGNAFFGTRSLVTDTAGRIYQADRIAMDEKAGQAELEGNAVIKDTANGVIVTANHIYLNNKNSSFLATNKPVMIIQQEKDSIYVAADTLFSGFAKMTNQISSEKIDEPTKDSFIEKPNESLQPSFNIKVKGLKPAKIDSSIRPLPNTTTDLIIKKSPLNKPDSVLKQNIDSVTAVTLKTESFSKDSIQADTIKGVKTINGNNSDTSVRYFLAFHHVRIFSDSMQSVCDSLYFSALDSVFRLFRNPIVWSGQSQINGDTIYLFTKNKKADRLYVFEKGMVINKSQSDLYNQIAGKTINGYFKNGVIDHARIRGQKAESIYYVQDSDSAYVGMNKANGDVIDMYFIKDELDKVKFINDVHGTMYPMRQIPPDEKFLKNFKWEDERRPKNKLELFE